MANGSTTFVPIDPSSPTGLGTPTPGLTSNQVDALTSFGGVTNVSGGTTTMQVPADQSSLVDQSAAQSSALVSAQNQHPDVLHLPHNLYAPTVVIGYMHFLYQWGPNVQFIVQPLNLHEADHDTGTDWAQKEVVGSMIFREWVGENDESLFIRGRVFPYRLGGFDQLQLFEDERRAGSTHPLIRGDGYKLGWFVCEKLVRSHTYLSGEGIGQQVAFEAVMIRVPMPDPAGYITDVWKASP